MSLKGTIILTGAAGGIASGFITEFLKTPRATQYHNIYIDHPSAIGRLTSLLASQGLTESHKYEILPVDLSSQSQIRTFASSLNSRVASSSLPAIRGLFLVAGGIFNSRLSDNGIDFTHEGIEKTFAINYLANFLLVLLLLQSMDMEKGRVIFMSSTTHDPSFLSNRNGHFKKKEWRLLWRDVDAMAEGRAEVVGRGEEFAAAMRRYGTSKFLMNLFMYELQRRLHASPTLSNVAILAMDPGAVGGTHIYEGGFPILMKFILKYVIFVLQIIAMWLWPESNGRLRTTEKVGRDLIWACWDEKVLGNPCPGALYLNGTDVVESSPETHDEKKQKELWRGSLEWVGIKEGETELGDLRP